MNIYNRFSPSFGKSIEMRMRSKSESQIVVNRQIEGYITGCVVLIIPKQSKKASPNDICKIYDQMDKTLLHKDKAHSLCAVTLQEIENFQSTKTQEIHKKLITESMKDCAKKRSPDYKYGYDFVFKFCIKQNIFKNNMNNLLFLTQIVIPTSNRRFPNIDITNVTEKTEPAVDRCIRDTCIRGVYEELGIDLNSPFGEKILSFKYQYDFRNQYSTNLPYNMDLDNNTSKVYFICADSFDLIQCQKNRMSVEDIHLLKLKLGID